MDLEVDKAALLPADLSVRHFIYDPVISTLKRQLFDLSRRGEHLADRIEFSFVAEIRFHSEWDFDDYHSNGSSIVSISGPDDNTLYSISDDFACDYGDSPILNTSRGECDPDAIDSVLEVLDIDIKRSVFMTVLATSMEVLLKDRLSDSDSSPIIQGGCLTELVSDAFDGLDD